MKALKVRKADAMLHGLMVLRLLEPRKDRQNACHHRS